MHKFTELLVWDYEKGAKWQALHRRENLSYRKRDFTRQA